MKILLVHDVQAYKQNGVSVSLGILATELKKMGHDIRILTLADGIRSHKDEGGNYYLSSVPAPVYPDIRIRLRRHSRLVKEIIAWDPDIIHTNCEFSTFRIAKFIRRRCAVPPVWVHTFHTDYRYYIGVLGKSRLVTDRFVPWYLNGHFSRSDALIVPTRKIDDYVHSGSFTRYEGYNTAVIPTGIDFSELRPQDAEDRENVRRELGVPSDAKLLIFLGRISPEKNLDELLDYFAVYRASHDDVYLLTVGNGPFKDTLLRHVKRLSLEDRVIVCDGVPHDRVSRYYNAADVFVSASVSETQGLTFYEAMYCGLPVLAKDRKCLEDSVTEGVNGAFFDDADSFAVSLGRIIDLRKNGGGASTLPDCFDSTFFARSVERLYQGLLAEERKAGRR